jgi:subtilase family serine protease
MNRILSSGLLSAAIALGFASGAFAQNAMDLQRSGNTYHVAACGQVHAGQSRCFARIVTDALGHVLQTPGSRDARVSGYGPPDLRDAYKITKNGSKNTIVAIVDAFGYDNAEADLGTYRANFGLPPCTTANGCFKKLNQTGQQSNYPAQNNGWADESALDMDMVSAMCPKCQIWLIESNDNFTNNLAAAAQLAATLGANVVSNSYGGGESGSQSFEGSYNHKGIVVTASTGDHGFKGGPQFPATSPHVIAVGGTDLFTDTGSDRGWRETAWSGAGSGCSVVYAKPKWQKDTGCAKRVEADVSAVADPSPGVAVFGPGANGNSIWFREGGTSVAAPLIAGIYGVAGKKGNYGKVLYKNADQLFDITAGSNGSCSGSYLCTSGPGYDGPTGLGTPNGLGAFK